jgi:phosphotriesterase-related protein
MGDDTEMNDKHRRVNLAVTRRDFLGATMATMAAAGAGATEATDANRYAVSVTGLLPASALGVTLPHEHLLLDFSVRYAPIPGEAEVQAPLKLEDRWRLIRHPAAHRINLVSLDVDTAVREARFFADAGGKTIVDLTPSPLTPGPAKLREIAKRTGLNVIAATGYYIDGSLPEWTRKASLDELADRLTEDLLSGGKERIRRGAIGEIAVEAATDLELRCVRAAARAQSRTGAPCYFHLMSGILPQFRESTERILGSYLEEGGDPHQLVLAHQDGSGDDPDYQLGLLRRGFWLEYDTFGFEGVFAFGPKYIQLPTDSRRIAELRVLVDAGFTDQLLISQDVCYRAMQRTSGGWGLAHILDTLWPQFLAVGLDERTMHRIMRDNPARLLAFATA